MTRRSKASGKIPQARRRKGLAKRGKAPVRRRSLAGKQKTEIVRLARELHESHERQEATAEVLKVISRSTFDLQTVLDTVVKSATHLCDAQDAFIFLPEGEFFRAAARFGFTPKYHKVLEANPVRVDRGSVAGRTALEGQVIHVEDVLADPNFTRHDLQKIGGFRAALGVPLLRGRKVIGVIFLSRTKPQPFTDKQIELVKNFAIQAVIAVENARLLNELRQRTVDLKESLEQQTATAEVLKVISTSAGELHSVFQAILENAVRICKARFGSLYLREGDGFRAAAMYNAPPAYAEKRAGILRPGPNAAISKAIRAKRPAQTVDVTKLQAYVEADPWLVAAVELAGYRSVLSVPMLHEGEAIGGINIFRQEAGEFADNQIELLASFAKQAVIAIENARLLNELRQRTDDLTESLEQQTATSEVLKVISSSQGELQPVFDAILANATQICEAEFGNLTLYDGEMFRRVALYNAPAAWAADLQRDPRRTREQAPLLYRLADTREIVHIADVLTEVPGETIHKFTGARSLVIVPMFKGDELAGGIGIYRQEVRPFSEKQIALLKSFADQAVIAIENARLLNELRQRTTDLTESLDQQTATSEVLKVISSSPGALAPVFQAILENGTRICAAKFGTLWLAEGDGLRSVAVHNPPPGFADLRRGSLRSPGAKTAVGRVLRTKKVVQIVDLLADAAYLERDPARVELVEVAGARTLVVVPMLKDDVLMGAIAIYRQEVQAFTDKQIALLQNFAAQAVIAIENARLLNELRESLEQQTATAKVLEVISSSPGDLKPVFEAILANAVRLCGAKFGNLYLREDDGFRAAAMHNAPLAYAEQRAGVVQPSSHSTLWQVAQSKQPAQTADMTKLPAFVKGDPWLVSTVSLAGHRSVLSVPMLREDELIGVITIFRQEPGAFADKQIELLMNFAKQAVIAIENARLLNELRESLDRQTATADILRVIAGTPEDSKRALDTIAATAARMFNATNVNFRRIEGNVLRVIGAAGPSAQKVREVLPDFPFEPSDPAVRSVLDRQIHIEDRSAILPDQSGEIARALRDLPLRSQAFTPLSRQGEAIGVMIVSRAEVLPFQQSELELMKGFADQAVIAIENARLLSELRESLEQQTATTEVLRVISSSPTNVQPVFDSIAESAVTLCGGEFSFVVRFDGKVMDIGGYFGLSAEGLDAYRSMMPMPAGEDTASGRAILRRAVAEVPDVEADEAYGVKAQGLARAAIYRSIVAVPLLHEGNPIGAITVARAHAGSFPERQIALLQAFADQAVIAIRNVGLFDEVQARTEELSESLQQQTATADVLKVISRSTFDLRTVLQTLVESAARLCEADKATITRQRGNAFYRAEAYGFSAEFMNYVKDIPIEPDRGSASGRALLEGRVIHIADVKNDPDYTWVEAQRLGAYRTTLCVPMLREGVPIGVLALTRSEVRPFTDRQIELVTTFADQAAIAIENVRLFDEIQDKSRQLEEASQHKSQFLANMSHELRTPLNAILGYTELMADGAYGEPSEKMSAVLKRLESNGRHLLGLINDVLDLSKIEAGQLVLELSDYSVQDIAQTVRSTLEPLAVDKKLAFKVEMAAELPPGRGDGRRLTQVLINLVGNAIKFTDAGEVAIKAEANNGSFYVAVRDTGPGISAADQTKLFQEFQQADNAITKKKGGTGLGLAISKRIIEMHGGRIWVESQLGQGATFAFTLPVVVDRQVEAAIGAT